MASTLCFRRKIIYHQRPKCRWENVKCWLVVYYIRWQIDNSRAQFFFLFFRPFFYSYPSMLFLPYAAVMCASDIALLTYIFFSCAFSFDSHFYGLNEKDRFIEKSSSFFLFPVFRTNKFQRLKEKKRQSIGTRHKKEKVWFNI